MPDSSGISILGSAIGAAFGALGGFAVAMLTENYRHHSEKWSLHIRALALIERNQNANIGILSDNAYSLREFYRAVESHRVPQVHCGPALVDRAAELDVQNLDIANRLFLLNNQLRRHNDDVGSFFSHVSEVRTSYLSGVLPQDVYLQFLAGAARAARVLRAGLRMTIRQASEMIAESQVQCRVDKDAYRSGISIPWKRTSKRIERVDIDQQLRTMRSDMAKTMRLSRQRVRFLRQVRDSGR